MCPWDLSLSGDNGWRPIDRSGGLTDSELLTAVERHPRLYNDEEQAVPRFSGDPEQGLACVGEPIDASTLRDPGYGVAFIDVATFGALPQPGPRKKKRPRPLKLSADCDQR